MMEKLFTPASLVVFKHSSADLNVLHTLFPSIPAGPDPLVPQQLSEGADLPSLRRIGSVERLIPLQVQQVSPAAYRLAFESSAVLSAALLLLHSRGLLAFAIRIYQPSEGTEILKRRLKSLNHPDWVIFEIVDCRRQFEVETDGDKEDDKEVKAAAAAAETAAASDVHLHHQSIKSRSIEIYGSLPDSIKHRVLLLPFSPSPSDKSSSSSSSSSQFPAAAAAASSAAAEQCSTACGKVRMFCLLYISPCETSTAVEKTTTTAIVKNINDVAAADSDSDAAAAGVANDSDESVLRDDDDDQNVMIELLKASLLSAGWLSGAQNSSLLNLHWLATLLGSPEKLTAAVCTAFAKKDVYLIKARNSRAYLVNELVETYIKLGLIQSKASSDPNSSSSRGGGFLISESPGEPPTQPLGLVTCESRLTTKLLQMISSTQRLTTSTNSVESSCENIFDLKPATASAAAAPAEGGEAARFPVLADPHAAAANLDLEAAVAALISPTAAAAANQQRSACEATPKFKSLDSRYSGFSTARPGSRAFVTPHFPLDPHNRRISDLGSYNRQFSNVRIDSSARRQMVSSSWDRTVMCLEILIDASPDNELPYLDLESAYHREFLSLLIPSRLGHSSLKAFLLSVSSLALVWVYHSPPAREFCEIRKALKLDEPEQFKGSTADSFTVLDHLRSSGISREALQTASKAEEDSSGPVPLSSLKVRKRALHIRSVAEDVVVALVAHWVLIHEAKLKRPAASSVNLAGTAAVTTGEGKKPFVPSSNSNSSSPSPSAANGVPAEQQQQQQASPSSPLLASFPSFSSLLGAAHSGAAGLLGLSSVGMPLSLLGRTWDSNWSNLCTLASLLERSNYKRLVDFVREIPTLKVVVADAGTVPAGVQLDPVIYLKSGTRVPVIPELIPDPTSPSFDSPKPGETHLVFFPPYKTNSSSSIADQPAAAAAAVRAAAVATVSKSPTSIARSSESVTSSIKRRSIGGGGSHSQFKANRGSIQVMAGGEFVDLTDEVKVMLFELICVCCAYQKWRWMDGEDLIEMREVQQEGEGGLLDSFDSSDDEDREEREKTSSAPLVLDEKRIKRKEERECRRLKKLVLREMNRNLDEEQDTPTAAAVGKEEEAPAKVGEEDKNAAAGTAAEATAATAAAGNRSNLFDEFRAEIISKFHQAENLKELRQEFRHRNVGAPVSSIKLDWSKYFDNAFPLTYFMERCGSKKLKVLLEEIPNLVISGDGGFMRVSTVEHAKQICGDAFPTEGFDMTGRKTCASFITQVSDSPRFQPKTYIEAKLDEEELSKIKIKGVFFNRVAQINASKHKLDSMVDISGSHRSSSSSSSSSSAASVSLNSIVGSIWELPTLQARKVLSLMLADLVVFAAIKQRADFIATLKGEMKTPTKKEKLILTKPFDVKEDSAAGTAGAAGELRDESLFELPELTADEMKTVEQFKVLGIEGLRLRDVNYRWNVAFTKFSPFVSFLKKSGFDNISDPNFVKFFSSEMKNVLIATRSPVDGNVLLYPAAVRVLDDSRFQRPPNMPNGVWLKLRTRNHLCAVSFPADGKTTSADRGGASRRQSMYAAVYSTPLGHSGAAAAAPGGSGGGGGGGFAADEANFYRKVQTLFLGGEQHNMQHHNKQHQHQQQHQQQHNKMGGMSGGYDGKNAFNFNRGDLREFPSVHHNDERNIAADASAAAFVPPPPLSPPPRNNYNMKRRYTTNSMIRQLPLDNVSATAAGGGGITDTNMLIDEMNRRIRSIEADITDQTSAVLALTQYLSMTAGKADSRVSSAAAAAAAGFPQNSTSLSAQQQQSKSLPTAQQQQRFRI